MNLKMHFDWLRIFFIEAKKKYMVHHDYVHSLMPIYVWPNFILNKFYDGPTGKGYYAIIQNWVVNITSGRAFYQ